MMVEMNIDNAMLRWTGKVMTSRTGVWLGSSPLASSSKHRNNTLELPHIWDSSFLIRVGNASTQLG